MIFVLLGTQDKPFTRLLDLIQTEINKKNINEEIIVQAGHTHYNSKDMKIFDLLPNDEILKLIDQASVIITHGGVASIIEALKKEKKVIACARLKKYGEHDNDHQLQIIKAFSKEGYILECNNLHKLSDALKKCENFKPKKVVSNTSNMVKLIEDYIDNL
jgi:UDP-N-acetylglucosamine transferase subunit ALG13